MTSLKHTLPSLASGHLIPHPSQSSSDLHWARHILTWNWAMMEVTWTGLGHLKATHCGVPWSLFQQVSAEPSKRCCLPSSRVFLPNTELTRHSLPPTRDMPLIFRGQKGGFSCQPVPWCSLNMYIVESCWQYFFLMLTCIRKISHTLIFAKESKSWLFLASGIWRMNFLHYDNYYTC